MVTRSDANGSQMGSRWQEWGSTSRAVIHVKPEHRRGFYVYVAWGWSRKRPLYIGKSVGLMARIGTHLRSAEWSEKVRRFEVYGFPSEEAMDTAEILAIQELDPVHNVVRRMTPAQVAEMNRHWSEMQAKKRADLASRREQEAQVRARWEQRMAGYRARPKAPKKQRRAPAEKVPSPWPRKRLRKTGDLNPDIFTPDQLAIIARVQNRGKAA